MRLKKHQQYEITASEKVEINQACDMSSEWIRSRNASIEQALNFLRRELKAIWMKRPPEGRLTW